MKSAEADFINLTYAKSADTGLDDYVRKHAYFGLINQSINEIQFC